MSLNKTVDYGYDAIRHGLPPESIHAGIAPPSTKDWQSGSLCAGT
jgi:hypothetical protein